MKSEEYESSLKAILSFYTVNRQKLKLCEECAELIHAVLKGNLRNIIEEMADVEVLLEQMKVAYECEEVVETQKQYKVTRQLVRMDEEKREAVAKALAQQKAPIANNESIKTAEMKRV